MSEAVNSRLEIGESGKNNAGESSQETAWVTASQQGDAMAFNRLVLKWERPIYNLTLRMLQNEDEAAEATQEVFLLAFRSIRQFRREARFSTWMYRIAANYCTTRLRQRPVHTHYSLDDDEAEPSFATMLPIRESHEAQLLREESRKQVTGALEKLSPEQRIVVELKFFQDLTFEEIALIAQAPLSTVKTRLYKGLENLKESLGKPRRRIIGG